MWKFIIQPIVLLLLASVPSTAQDTASFIAIGGGSLDAVGVSSDGSVVAGNLYPGGSGYRWTSSGGIQLLGAYPGATGYVVWGLSGDGATIVGSVGSGDQAAFKWAGGSFMNLGTLPGGGPGINAATDASYDGAVIAGVGTNSGGGAEAWRWMGSIQGLGDIAGGNSTSAFGISPDGTVIVGYGRIYISPLEPRIVAFRSVGGGNVQSLGAGGFSESTALAASDSGKVIVGNRQAEHLGPGTAARWTIAGGWESLGGVQGSSVATDVSADGSIIVGYGAGSGAFIWDRARGARNLKQVLETDFGLDLTGWTLTQASAISDDGTTIVGHGSGPGGSMQAWRATIPPGITNPRPDEIWIAGTTDTIRWHTPNMDTVLIEYSTDYDNGNGTFHQLADQYPADSGMFIWKIPDTLLSRKCIISITDISDPTKYEFSGIFRIKPYVLTRNDVFGGYYDYAPPFDPWGFANRQSEMWPWSWYSRFDYRGIDPFTGLPYPLFQGWLAFSTADSSDFPDWVSFVSTFTVGACYLNLANGTYSPTALSRWRGVRDSWNGSCYGIAISNAIAFRNGGELLAHYPGFPGFIFPGNVVSDTNVIPVINELFTHQFGDPHRSLRTAIFSVRTPNETLNELKAMLASEDAPIQTLNIYQLGPGGGGHAILAWGLAQDTLQPNIHYVSVYDNNYPESTDAQIVIDTALNGGTGGWTYSLLTGWGGSRYILLADPAINHLTPPTLPKAMAVARSSPFILAADRLEILPKGAGSVRIEDSLGNTTGYLDSLIRFEIPGSYPLIATDGSEHPPYGYELSLASSSITTSDFSDSGTTAAYFFTGNRSFMAGRSDAEPGQSDRYFFDGGLTTLNPDTAMKSMDYYVIVNESVREKTFGINAIPLLQGDSLRLELVGPDVLKINSTGGAGKAYDIEVTLYADTGVGRFTADDVPFGAGTVSHTLAPEWSDPAGQVLRVFVDEGNDGSVEDTLVLSNNLTGTDDDRYARAPVEYRLDQNYPNPFNSGTVIRYQVPASGHTLLRVYDVLGRLVATLVDGVETPGHKSVEWDASDMPSGVYIYRLTSGSYTAEKKMILAR